MNSKARVFTPTITEECGSRWRIKISTAIRKPCCGLWKSIICYLNLVATGNGDIWGSSCTSMKICTTTSFTWKSVWQCYDREFLLKSQNGVYLPPQTGYILQRQRGDWPIHQLLQSWVHSIQNRNGAANASSFLLELNTFLRWGFFMLSAQFGAVHYS